MALAGDSFDEMTSFKEVEIPLPTQVDNDMFYYNMTCLFMMHRPCCAWSLCRNLEPNISCSALPLSEYKYIVCTTKMRCTCTSNSVAKVWYVIICVVMLEERVALCRTWQEN